MLSEPCEPSTIESLCLKTVKDLNRLLLYRHAIENFILEIQSSHHESSRLKIRTLKTSVFKTQGSSPERTGTEIDIDDNSYNFILLLQNCCQPMPAGEMNRSDLYCKISMFPIAFSDILNLAQMSL